LTDNSHAFCSEKKDGCATWVRPPTGSYDLAKPLAARDVIIAVKTVSHFHATRIPLIHKLWGSSSPVDVLYLSNADYTEDPNADELRKHVVNLSPEFGDAVDPKIESTSGGSGHCSKMVALLQYLYKHEPGRLWYVVTDDDTLLDVNRLLEILSVQDHSSAIYIGERYGWAHTETREGNNYMTTGAGMAMSASALAKLVACRHCTCSSSNAPDDMTLGSWFHGLPVAMVHDESFHQAEPHNYHPEILKYGPRPVSFHRYGLRLPANTPQAELAKSRSQNWRQWQRSYFSRRDSHSEL
jgi:hypothetical protein